MNQSNYPSLGSGIELQTCNELQNQKCVSDCFVQAS
jgi:hypothetical protein